VPSTNTFSQSVRLGDKSNPLWGPNERLTHDVSIRTQQSNFLYQLPQGTFWVDVILNHAIALGMPMAAKIGPFLGFAPCRPSLLTLEVYKEPSDGLHGGDADHG
jgi:hypothetical protein